MKNDEKTMDKKIKTPREKLIEATTRHGIERNNEAIKNSTDLKEIFENISLEKLREEAWKQK